MPAWEPGSPFAWEPGSPWALPLDPLVHGPESLSSGFPLLVLVDWPGSPFLGFPFLALVVWHEPSSHLGFV